ncbi:hypothetical protein ACFLWB_01960 [Chloroflexota bacterium]
MNRSRVVVILAFILLVASILPSCQQQTAPTSGPVPATSPPTPTLTPAPASETEAPEPTTNETAPQIVSDDKQATLSIPEGALLEGTKLEDISITKLGGKELDESVYAIYELKPDGVTFEKPVTVSITAPAREGDISLLLSYDGNSVEFIDTTEVSLDKSANTVSVTAPIEHFSRLKFVEGIFLVRTQLPLLGEKKVREKFDLTVKVFYKIDIKSPHF